MSLYSGNLLLAFALKVDKKLSANTINKILSSGIQYPDDFEGVVDMMIKQHPEIERITHDEWDNAITEAGKNTDGDIYMYALNDNDYPSILRQIPSAPPVLFVKGNQNIFNELPGIAIVGARKATANGKEIAKRLSMFFVEKGWVVVSGLAQGIDAAAHQGVLDAGGKTIAVLAHGLQHARPKMNEKLGSEILETGGAWVSEHSIGVEPRREFFVPRNRMQIGLSAGSIIVESDVKGGSITQAKYCVSQKRPLFSVVPAEPENKLNLFSGGTIMMTKEMGAFPIKTKEDYPEVLDILEHSKEKILSM